MSELGKLLNTTIRQTACPRCHRPGLMDVHEFGVRWACGHAQALPPMPHQKMRPWSKK